MKNWVRKSTNYIHVRQMIRTLIGQNILLRNWHQKCCQSKTNKMRRKKSRVPTWKRSRTVPEKLTFLEVTSIVDLPELALINIFKYLSLKEVENCYLACPKWKNIIGLDFFQPHLRLVSSLLFEMKKSFYLTGWTEDTQNVELILKIWKEFRPFRGVTLFCL